jgi:hypothetical protein
MLGPVLVSSARLAVHIGCTRQYIEQWLVPFGVVERNAQNLFDQSLSRQRHIKHLRSERKRSPRTAADAEHTAVKTGMLNLRLMEKRGQLWPQEALIHRIVGATVTGLSSLPARCAPHDPVTRKNIERCALELRKELSAIGERMADELEAA